MAKYNEPRVVSYKSAQYTQRGSEMSARAGERLAEAFGRQGDTQILKENFGITFKESGQTTANNTGAYTTLLATTLYEAAVSRIEKELSLVEINTELMNGGGNGAIQLPKLTPTVAYEVAEGVVVSRFDEGVTSLTLTCRKVVAGTSITWEIMKRGMGQFAQYVLKNAADSVARKLASDIVNGLAAGATHTETGGVDFAAVTQAEEKIVGATYANGVNFGFIPNAIVLNGTGYRKFVQDADVKASMSFASTLGGVANAAQIPLMFGNLEVIRSPYLTAAEAIVLEKGRNLLIKESELETFEGAIPGRLYDNEIIAMMSYVLALLFPQSVCKITA